MRLWDVVDMDENEENEERIMTGIRWEHLEVGW